ncbi:tetraprenyl-beta-curcumene synthase family protein [Salicibibacter halophilus]|uniref:Tetraprenyl-beta-curcumene synthase family protein n=1 Tax=Salicibibacter halophilus TaxID=2502791 RepID=A0A514LGC2_9BACI|nr:tetraprenyl-beta-curcumene synthase family protein [Salicibibacter halophilus]QDI90896.1 tetraprenyl-beta-curcumene synthase family protein [Salicibibacter halophilus]
MAKSTPSNPVRILQRAKKETLPKAHKQLEFWKNEGQKIRDKEIREQAVWTVSDKTFHCEGGSILALLAGDNQDPYIQFMVGYQSICDYLDTLCDKNDSHNPDDFRALHQALLDSLEPHGQIGDYYQYRPNFDDDGYLEKMVTRCREAIVKFPGFSSVKEDMKEVSQYYIDFQVYKHVEEDQREGLLYNYYVENQDLVPGMRWYEFSCAVASTLALYCLAAYAAEGPITKEDSTRIKEAYFPWMQGLHIMLDYFIDQEEDLQENEMNFVAYYESKNDMLDRFKYIDHEATKRLKGLPDEKFHLMIKKGLYALYLSDGKVRENEAYKKDAKEIIKLGGKQASFFFQNLWMFKRTV